MNNDLKSIILNNSISLNKIGSFNFAYAKDDALILISKLFNLGIPIIGGDILYFNETSYMYSGTENWSIDQRERESKEAYRDRSYLEAIKYISSFNLPENDSRKYVFEIVLDIPNEQRKEMFGDIFGFDKLDAFNSKF